METAIFIILILIAIALFLAVRKNWISDTTLQQWANVATVVALIAAVLVLIMPAPSSPESPAIHSLINTPIATTDAPVPTQSIPTATPTSIPVPTIAPTSVPTTIPTREIQLTATLSCPAVSGPFATLWISVQGRIGCAIGNVVQGLMVEENFESGKMFWREPIDYSQALVLFNNGTWRIFEHSPYVEGSAEFSCPDNNTPSQCPPTPKRGFGVMWCNIPEIRSGLGNAIDCERGYQGSMQQFEQGFMIQTDSGNVYVFYNNRQWEQR